MKIKSSFLMAFICMLLGLTQTVSASWENGGCPSSPAGIAPCIEWSDGVDIYHFNGSGGHAEDWHGHPNGGDFVFTGATFLVFHDIALDCDLTWNGQISKTYDLISDGWKMSFKITDAYFSGGFVCQYIEVGGFPWYIDENQEHGPYGSVGIGIPYDTSSTPPISLIGSLGAIDMAIPVWGVSITDGHMHDVEYDNIDAFSIGIGGLDSNIYVDGASDTLTGYSMETVLHLNPIGDTLVIK